MFSKFQKCRSQDVLEVDDPYRYEFINPVTYMSGCTSCYKLGFFTKLFIRIGLVKTGKVNTKTKAIIPDPFDNFIKEI